MDLSADDVRRIRLVGQGVVEPLADPSEMIHRLTCTQSQEFAQSLWSLRLRTAAPVGQGAGQRAGQGMGQGVGQGSAAHLRAAFDRGEFVRTHVLRPTWHSLDPADLRWLLEVTGPRVQRRLAGMFRTAGVTPAQLDRSLVVITEAVAGGPRTRDELRRSLAEAGLDTGSGIVVGNLIMNAELTAAVCSGPVRGKQHSYVAVADRCPDDHRPLAPAAELVRRFVLGHGPVSVRDVSRWSGLNLTQVRQALAESDELELIVVDEVQLVHHPATSQAALAGAAGGGAGSRVLVLPEYDELTLTFRDVPWRWLDDAPMPVPATMANRNPGLIMVGDRLAGYWARSLTDRQLAVTAAAPGIPEPELTAELATMADFYGVELVVEHR